MYFSRISRWLISQDSNFLRLKMRKNRWPLNLIERSFLDLWFLSVFFSIRLFCHVLNLNESAEKHISHSPKVPRHYVNWWRLLFLFLISCLSYSQDALLSDSEAGSSRSLLHGSQDKFWVPPNHVKSEMMDTSGGKLYFPPFGSPCAGNEVKSNCEKWKSKSKVGQVFASSFISIIYFNLIFLYPRTPFFLFSLLAFDFFWCFFVFIYFHIPIFLLFFYFFHFKENE